MAIKKEKYVDITSGVGGASAVGRRELIGRVFTASAAMAFRNVKEFNDADEVMHFFGAKSPEYDFAVKYFGFVSKSVTKPEKLSFASWGYGNPSERTTYLIEQDAKTGIFTVTNDKDDAELTFEHAQDALDYCGENCIISLSLAKDIVYISEATFADKPHYEDVLKGTGGIATVTSDERLLNGITIAPSQVVTIELNGHIVSGDRHAIVNKGILTLNDSKDEARVFTTNLETMLGELPHSSRYEAGVRDTCEAVRNEGYLVINGGWYGTDKCTTYEHLNHTTWGQAVACYNGSRVIINGGFFTTCTYWTQSEKVGKDIGEKSIFCDRDADGKLVYNYGDKWKPYAAIIDSYEDAYIVVNGGYFYGLFNDVLEIKGENTTEDEFGIVVINGGSFVSGFTDMTYIPDGSYTRQSFFQAAAPSMGYKPSELDGSCGFSVIDVKNAKLLDNVSEINSEGKNTFNHPKGSAKYPALRFTGRVMLGNVSCNFEFSKEFKTFKQEYNDAATRYMSETPVESLSRIDELDDNCGSFAFIDKLTASDIASISEWNASKNFKYLYSVAVTPENAKKVLLAAKGMSGTCFTLDKFDEKAYFMPMALLAATKYDRVNATKCFMYQQFNGVRYSVSTTAESDFFDAFDVDGKGTNYPINYYGFTRQGNTALGFYQRGYNADKLDTAVYCNEIWLKDAITVELLNMFIANEKVPANDVGAAMCKTAVLVAIQDALNNGAIIANKTLTQTQKTYVDSIAGVEGAWINVEQEGYWLNIVVRQKTTNGTTMYYADYVLIYSKGDAIRKVEGSDVLI